VGGRRGEMGRPLSTLPPFWLVYPRLEYTGIYTEYSEYSNIQYTARADPYIFAGGCARMRGNTAADGPSHQVPPCPPPLGPPAQTRTSCCCCRCHATRASPRTCCCPRSVPCSLLPAAAAPAATPAGLSPTPARLRLCALRCSALT